jgi:hypothetical protein
MSLIRCMHKSGQAPLGHAVLEGTTEIIALKKARAATP